VYNIALTHVILLIAYNTTNTNATSCELMHHLCTQPLHCWHQKQGADKYDNLYGTVVHAKGNISIELLRSGMARMLDWTAAFLPRETTTAMRAAENDAKLQQLRLWRGYVAPTIQVSTHFSRRDL
jgi:Staphylococcal nuclease homologue